MFNLIEEEHKEYLATILAYDFTAYDQINNQLATLNSKESQCKDELQKIQIVIDRVSYFDNFLKKLDSQELTQIQHDLILEYIKKGVEFKWPASDYFTDKVGVGFFIKLKRILQNDQIWIYCTGVAQQIHEIENGQLVLSGNQDKYIQLQKELSSILILKDPLLKQRRSEQESMSKLFCPKDISDVDQLNTLCNTKTELLIIEDKKNIDADFAAVIQMRAKSASDKESRLIVMPFSEFQNLMKSDKKINGVIKLSFLHHGGLIKEFGYVEKISDYIENLPDLEEIVLRGCGSAQDPKKNSIVYEVKKVNNSYDTKAPVQGYSQVIIQQTKDIHGEILTKISWRTLDPIENKSILHEIKDIKNIPLINDKKVSDEILTRLENIPGIPFLKHSPAYVSLLKNSFFNPNKKLSLDELAEVKKAVPRARTEPTVTENDLVSSILNNMTAAQKDKISVKGYVGSYEVHHGRVIPGTSHDYDNEPKAVRIGPKHK